MKQSQDSEQVDANFSWKQGTACSGP